MKMDADRTVGLDGLLRKPDGSLSSTFVSSVRSGILEFPEASVICLRLYENSGAENAEPGADASAQRTDVQVHMSERTARLVVRHLSELLSELPGKGHVRQ